ncbi:hypothetical protein Hanom_Chr12g01085041 [Helianthus anomalus]
MMVLETERRTGWETKKLNCCGLNHIPSGMWSWPISITTFLIIFVPSHSCLIKDNRRI